MEILSRQIEFPSSIRPLSIIPVGVPASTSSMPRSLVRRGELTHLIWRGDDGKLTFGKKFTRSSVYVFLFTDLIVFTKKRSDDAFTVIDYCPRSLMTVSSGDVIPQLPAKDLVMGGKHLILMTLLENHDGKMVEMVGTDLKFSILLAPNHLHNFLRYSLVNRKRIVNDGFRQPNRPHLKTPTKSCMNNGTVHRS